MLKVARPLLTALLTAGISQVAKGAGNGQPPDGNGHSTEEEISSPS
jgi:hypothetical protein